ncbi:hypothetical protein [Paraburkholderia sp. JPY419]|uniref:hypothetical protein n=1 Tax=Paraburkholderia sp. JPY419 TaxID=667660 RepID=UPI003D1E5801
MCSCADTDGCVYRSEADYHEERARQAAGSAIEHDVFTRLRDPAVPVSPAALPYANLLHAQTLGASVTDLLVTSFGLYWWWGGREYFAALPDCAVPDAQSAALRLVA